MDVKTKCRIGHRKSRCWDPMNVWRSEELVREGRGKGREGLVVG